MDENMKKYLLAAGIIVIIIIVAIAAGSGHGGNNTPTTTPSSTSSITSTTTSTITTETSTTQTPTTTIITSTITGTITKTITTTNSYEYAIPEEVTTPVTGNFIETITAYGLSVSKTTYTATGMLTYNGEVYLMYAGGNAITIEPVTISSVVLHAALIAGDLQTQVPLDWAYFPFKAFESATLTNFAVNGNTVEAEYFTVIGGQKVTGLYTYENGTIILAITWPHTYTLGGIVFEVNGTYIMTYSGFKATTTAISTPVTTTTVETTTSTTLITSTISP